MTKSPPLLFPMKLLFILSLSCVLGALHISLSNPGELRAATLQSASRLMGYYKPNMFGTVSSSGSLDSTGVQFYQSGIFWETLMKTTQVTGDDRFIGVTTGALVNASFGPYSTFLGPDRSRKTFYYFLDTWNDDILWWGQGALSGAEIYSPTAKMAGGQSYLTLATNTLNEVWDSWDTSTCAGGLYWTRDRTAGKKSADLKTTITNVQFISFAARLYELNKNETLIVNSIKVYNWLQNIRLINLTQGEIFDGASDLLNCTDAESTRGISYLYGQLIEGLVKMYKVTGTQKFLQDAEVFARKSFDLFTLNSVIRDFCEPNCSSSRVAPKGILLRGYATLYPFASPSIKNEIRIRVENSFQGMLKTCDINFNCNNYWGADGLAESDFHRQLNVVELFNAAMVIYAPLSSPTKFQTQEVYITAPILEVRGGENGMKFTLANLASLVMVLFTGLFLFQG